MKLNMGQADRVVRLVISAILVLAILMQWVSGLLMIIAGVFALVLLGTAVVRVCPLYLPFGLSSLRKKL
jgi:hypothetical protein|tara:strand:+ start:966 stop:1172 length:207 start_codon:yes stop_codon:yes gene_type:complete